MSQFSISKLMLVIAVVAIGLCGYVGLGRLMIGVGGSSYGRNM
jgi:hypothetical protein